MLKWKLQNALQKRDEAGATNEYHWSNQCYTLQEIVQLFKLPCLVLCTSDCSLDWNAFHFNLKQPLLVHSTRTTLKATAHCLRKSEPSGQYEKIGTCVVIPEDYTGWFTLIGPDKDGTKPFENIREISQSDVNEFLVVKAVIGKTLNDERRVVSNGEILRKIERSTASDVTVNNNFLLCKDEKDEDVIISLSHRGKFYKVSKDPKCENSVFQIHDLLKNNLDTPIYIRHVVGEIPMLTSAYSSLLELVSVSEETTILASTLDEKTMMPLELQTNSRIKFKISLNQSRLRHVEPFSEAIEFCQTDGEDYMKGMKVAFQMSPETWMESNTSIASSNDTLALENITSSLGGFGVVDLDEESYYSESDIGEEDAQSEFTFKWTSEDENKEINDDTQAVKDGVKLKSQSDVVSDGDNLNSQNGVGKDENNLNSQNGAVKDGVNLNSQSDVVCDGDNLSSQKGAVKDRNNLNNQHAVFKDTSNSNSRKGIINVGKSSKNENGAAAAKDRKDMNSPRNTTKDEKGVPKVFNSCIKSSRESVVWNEEPDVV